ncbi:MAG: response regulator receiver modulated diguanylate cyclase/phosphodiesterase with sensor(s) [Proteobacteria bacterium]|nr:response regulator receiver modulated diguanylate cyclase/phosphodiesterase with sensor(s) [Pseudomonadota bacterium]
MTTAPLPVQDLPDLFRQALDASDHAALITDLDGIIEYANPALLQISGYELEELLGAQCRIFQSGLTTPSVYQALWQTLRGGAIWEGELLNRRKNGELFWQHLHITPLKSGDTVSHYFSSASDLSEQRAIQQRIDWLSTFDPLTGLPNRSQFVNRLKSAIQDVIGTHHCLTLVHLDIDSFSAINERYGEQESDRILKQVGETLRGTIRHGDILARLDGDEFGLILHNNQIDEQHPEAVQRFMDSISGPISVNGIETELSFSMGIAGFPGDGSDADSLMHSASTARLAAQAEGGNRFMFSHGGPVVSKNARLDLIGQLRRAIDKDELVLHYQPQVSLFSGEISGFEALVRWNHADHGLVQPAQFIPLAEETGLIIPMSEWILDAACRQMRDWNRQGLPALRIAVNMSARHLHMKTLPEKIAQLLAHSGLAPWQLELELTESMMMHDVAVVIGIVDQLKNLGVQLSLDDFGTGYSSLAYLSRLSINALKIDQSFVRDITSNPVNASIVQATIAMAHKLGMRVIAEGVETEAQRIFLRRHGCDEIQGFGFSRPVPAEQAGQMLREGRRLESSTPAADDHDLPTLMLVDDEPSIISTLRRVFHHQGYRLLCANCAADALELLAVNHVDVILSDQRMPDMTGVELLSRVKELYPKTVRIVLSGYADINAVTDAINKGAIYKYFTKPWDNEILREEIRRVFYTLRE